MERGNQKYRGVAEVSSRAGQPQARLIASVHRVVGVFPYQPVRMCGKAGIDCRPTDRTEGLMVRRRNDQIRSLCIATARFSQYRRK